MSVHHHMINRSTMIHPYHGSGTSNIVPSAGWPSTTNTTNLIFVPSRPSTQLSSISSYSTVPQTSTSSFSSTSNSSITSLPYSRSDQLRVRIHENHLSYLSREDNPTKFELRNKLENLVTEYLSLVPNSQKFSFKEIGECLRQTIQSDGFNPSAVITAFETIERYTTNLLNYPWRHEYRTIFTYSGFFYRKIDCTLIGYRPILELIGFIFDQTLNAYRLVEIPIDPDKLSRISLECLVAIVECKIILNIYDSLQKQSVDITWNDICSIRNDYVCNQDNAIRLARDMKKTGMLIDLDLPDYSVKQFNKLDLFSPMSNTGKSIVNLDNDQVESDDEEDRNEQLLTKAMNYLESNLDSIDFIDGTNTTTTTTTSTNSNDDNRFAARDRSTMFQKQPIVSTVPTANVIQNYSLKNDGKKNVNSLETALMSEISQFETNRKNPQSVANNTKNAFSAYERKQRGSEPMVPVKPVESKPVNNQQQQQHHHIHVVNLYPKNAKTESIVQTPNVESRAIHSNSSSPIRKWSCSSCTYQNDINRDVCEMCHRSRRISVDAPLVSGGRECSRCTLVNGKDDQFCKACETSLEDSPTYI